MKKVFSFIILVATVISLFACSSPEKISAPVSDKIVICSENSNTYIEITDAKIIQQITDHINYFEYQKSKSIADKSVVYTVEWLGENDKSLKKLSLCVNGNGIIYNDCYYKVIGDYALDIEYFERIFDDLSNRTIYRLPERLVRCLFGTTPEDFWGKYIPLYDACEDFRDKAYLDDENNVVLLLTEEQKLAWLLDLDTDIEDFDAIDGVEIAEDFSKVTITRPKSQMYEFIWNNYNLYTSFDMVVRQIILGKDPNTIVAEIVLIDEDTKEIIYSAKWPEEEIKFEW